MENKLPRVTGILQAEGFTDFSKVNPDIMARAQNFGTALHSTTELWDKKILKISTLDKELIPYLDGWIKFIKDYEIVIEPTEIENHLISTKWGFQGTPDRYPIIKGKRTIIDLKSSTVMYPATALQTAAYQILVEENTGFKVQQRWGIQLNEKGAYKIIPYSKASDRTVFLSALNTFKWKKENL